MSLLYALNDAMHAESYCKGAAPSHSLAPEVAFMLILWPKLCEVYSGRVLLVGMHAYAPFGGISTVANTSHWLEATIETTGGPTAAWADD